MLTKSRIRTFVLPGTTGGGRDAPLFQAPVDTASEHGRVSPFYFSTDRESVSSAGDENPWIRSSSITAKYSRRIVPMFLDFLKTQYYFFHSKDPDARELQIDKLVETKRWDFHAWNAMFELRTHYLPVVFSRISTWTKELMNRKILQNRLLAFLKAFAAVKGSQQLYQRSVLLSVFYVNLSHQDATVAGTSLTCLVNFRLPYVSHYADKLQHLLRKGGLRDALLDFNLSRESEMLHNEHRRHLLPVIERILFGRLSTSSMRGLSRRTRP
jgi:hypothetical protein